jgi:hypothetical protein
MLTNKQSTHLRLTVYSNACIHNVYDNNSTFNWWLKYAVTAFYLSYCNVVYYVVVTIAFCAQKCYCSACCDIGKSNRTVCDWNHNPGPRCRLLCAVNIQFQQKKKYHSIAYINIIIKLSLLLRIRKNNFRWLYYSVYY